MSFFFSLPSWALALLVLGVIGGATSAGYAIGRRFHEHHAALKEPFGVLQGALLGIVGLILAFGLSLALGRYEDRRAATVAEANAIGDTFLRAQLLADPARIHSIRLLRRYTGLALEISKEIPGSSGMNRTTAAEGAIQRQLWRAAGESIAAAPQASAPRLYVDSLNGMIDAQASRLSALTNRVPTEVFALEVVGASIALGMLAAHISILGRGLVALFGAAALVTLLLLTTFDLDRPTRGVIRVPDTPFVQLRAFMTLPPAAPGP